MLFHSWPFVALLLVTLAICTIVPAKSRWVVLLASSMVFYGWWRIDYLTLMLLTAMSCYVSAIVIERAHQDWNRRAALIAVLVVNITVLGVFKYWGLFAEIVNVITASGVRPELGLLLPVGISFYTFQSVGYAIDVYRRKVAAERNPFRFILFVSFFPQLVAGPIERAARLLPALRAPIVFSSAGFRFGLWLMAWGFFKKLVIADRAALYVDNGFNNPMECGGAVLLLSMYAFAIQIYCDFSGYSDIATGTARLFGIRLMRNFDRPYGAVSLREFWSRWHISLSTWFRDYLYVPLGGNRVGAIHWAANVLLVFAVSGLWHGAAWTFLWWGLLHGVAVVTERLWKPLPRIFRWLITIHIVVIAWALFRSNSLFDAQQIVARIVSHPFSFARFRPADTNGLDAVILSLAIGWLCVVERPLATHLRFRVTSWVGNKNGHWTIAIVTITCFLLLNFGLFSNPARFIYFQF